MYYYEKIISDAVRRIFGVTEKLILSRPDAKFGDLATNIAMILAGKFAKESAATDQVKDAAKISKNSDRKNSQTSDANAPDRPKNPREIAQKIAAELEKSGEFSEISIAGPGFLNFRIPAKNLARILAREFAGNQKNSRNFGENADGQGKIAVVEYPSPNMAKPYSVGHLRSGNQGWAAKNLLEAAGWNVITDNHLGDYGAPFGIWVTGFLKFSSEEKLAERGIYELGDIYVKMREEMKKEAAAGENSLKTETENWLLKLERGDQEAAEFSEKFNQISLDHIHKVMRRLGIATEHELGEKFFAPLGKSAVQNLLEKNLATENGDGSVIVDLSDQGIETPILIQKSNGANLYATNDLATLLWRHENWHPDLVVYSVGGEQKFYFEQIAALAKKLGLKEEIFHLWFGTIDQISPEGKREKMSSRKGVVLMEELLDYALERARENAKSAVMSEADLQKISVGAIKFSDFAADRRTGMLFDWDKMFSLTGFSGPYVQYAAVRIRKILRDNNFATKDFSKNLAKKDESSASDYDFAAEKTLILKLLEYPEILRVAQQKLEPHRVANYVYELAREMNRYYERTPVATAAVAPEIREKRLEFLAKVERVFAHSLGILGIEIPEKM